MRISRPASCGRIPLNGRARWIWAPSPTEVSAAFVKRVTSAALRIEDLIVPNALCLWLGGGGAQAVVDRLATYDVEVTDVARYNPWLRAAWRSTPRRRWNKSKKFVSLQELPTDDVGVPQQHHERGSAAVPLNRRTVDRDRQAVADRG